MDRLLAGALQYAVFLFALTLHEFSHAATATLFGDPTPKAYRRLTLNPIPHMDPFGTVVLPMLGIVLGGAVIGYASTPINPSLMRRPRRGALLTAAAGPLSNLATCVLAALLLRFFIFLDDYVLLGKAHNVLAGARAMLVNLALLSGILGVFNLLPVGPLDGAAVWEALFPNSPWTPRLRGGTAWLIGLAAWILVLHSVAQAFVLLIMGTVAYS
jgi:Zn-dependent protease